MKTLLVLYEELADYFLVAINYFGEQHQYEIHVVKKQKNIEAPFEFNYPKIHLYARENYDYKKLKKLSQNIAPDAILCGGWGYSPYLRLCAFYHPKITVILGFDNKYENSLKQNILALGASFLFKFLFHGCFVAGESQKKLAIKLGFKQTNIEIGAYCCNSLFLEQVFQRSYPVKSEVFPKRFIYVGRYLEHKGIKQLWKAFIELYEEGHTEWELWCLGTGEVVPVEHPAIKHFGFVQPHALDEFMQETGVFVLPSFIEPWGLVVHEFATAGFHLLCSTSVGASEAFLAEGENGFMFEVNKHNDLKAKLLAFMMLNQDQLAAMAEKSNAIAQSNTLEKWSKKLLELIL